MSDEMLQDDVTESIDDMQVDDSQEVSELEEVANEPVEQNNAVDDFVELNQDQQKKFNKLTWEKNQAKREAQELKARIEALEQSNSPVQQEAKPVEQGEVKPPNPDLVYSDPDKYNSDLVTWQESVIQRASAIAENTAKQTLEKTKTASEQAKQEAAKAERVQGYADRAIKSGIDADRLYEAENIVAAYRPSPEIASFILEDESGPQLTNYLANNQNELEALVSMSPMRAAVKLEQLRVKALNVKTATKAPDPVETLSGRSSVSGESPLIKGATFE